LLGLDAPQKLDVEQVIDVNEQALRQRHQDVLAQLSISARAELLAVLRKEKGIDDSEHAGRRAADTIEREAELSLTNSSFDPFR
jgi:hypothetical protein